MQLTTYLLFNGNCEQAFRFYEQKLGGKIEYISTAAGTPAESHMPPEWRDKVLHASMTVAGNTLMASDAPPPNQDKMGGFYVCINLSDPAEGQRLFDTLAENGTVHMPFGKTFWADGFGMLNDQFGVPWMINSGPSAPPV